MNSSNVLFTDVNAPLAITAPTPLQLILLFLQERIVRLDMSSLFALKADHVSIFFSIIEAFLLLR